MRRHRGAPVGQALRPTLDGAILSGNHLGDSSRRDLHVDTPAGHPDGRGLPLLVDLVGFSGSGLSHTNWKSFTENLAIPASASTCRSVCIPVRCLQRAGAVDYRMDRSLPFLVNALGA